MIGIEAAFQGRIGKGPDMRQSQGGKLFCTASIAVETGTDAPQWVSIVAFGERAEALGAIVKGARVYLEGRLSLSTYTRQNGVEVTTLKLIANTIQPLGQIGRQKPKAAGGAKSAAHDWQRPFDEGPSRMDQDMPF